MTRSDRIAAKIQRGAYRGSRREAKAWRRYSRALRAEVWADPREFMATLAGAYRSAAEALRDFGEQMVRAYAVSTVALGSGEVVCEPVTVVP